jgi:photosystem II stability/assembly factor-like uncharacterized protein
VLGKATLPVEDLNQTVVNFFASRDLLALRCEHNWKILFIHSSGDLFGCLYPNDCDLYRSIDDGKSVSFVHSFPEQIKSIFISNHNSLLVCVKGAIYHSADDGISFQKVLDLGSPISFIRYNNAITETPDGILYMGEYGNIYDKNGWRKLAFLYSSIDDGKSWRKSDFLIGKGTNKHVHIVKYSKVLQRLMVADGDNYKKLWISGPLDTFNFDNLDLKPVNRFHIQMGGYTSAVESNGKIFFGTDYQGGTNFIVETTDGRVYKKKVVPDPYRRSPIDNLLVRKSARGNEIWGNLPYSTTNSKCLLMVSTDDGISWEKVFEYNRSTYTVWLISSSIDPTDKVYLSVENALNNERVVYKISDKAESI